MLTLNSPIQKDISSFLTTIKTYAQTFTFEHLLYLLIYVGVASVILLPILAFYGIWKANRDYDDFEDSIIKDNYLD